MDIFRARASLPLEPILFWRERESHNQHFAKLHAEQALSKRSCSLISTIILESITVQQSSLNLIVGTAHKTLCSLLESSISPTPLRRYIRGFNPLIHQDHTGLVLHNTAVSHLHSLPLRFTQSDNMSTSEASREDSAALMPPPSSTTHSAAAATSSPSATTQPAPIDESRLTDDDIDSLIASLSPTSELEHLRSIEKTIRETQARRRKETEEHTAKIHALQSALSDLRKQSTRQAAEWRSLASHAETIEKLDNRNFDLAKKINEQESVLSGMQNQVVELKRMCEELEEVDVEDETEMDRDA